MHVSTSGNASYQPTLLTGGKFYLGIGPSQCEPRMPVSTLGELRNAWGDESVGEGLAPTTPCHVVGDGEGLCMVMVRASFLTNAILAAGV